MCRSMRGRCSGVSPILVANADADPDGGSVLFRTAEVPHAAYR